MFLRFLHYLGMSLWFGGAVAAMVIARSIRSESLDLKAKVYKALAQVHALVVAPGAVLTTLTGFLITGSMYQAGESDVFAEPGMIIMQTAGTFAALIVLAIALPAVNRRAALARLEQTPEQKAILAKLRTRNAVASTAAGVLFVLSLFGVMLLR